MRNMNSQSVKCTVFLCLFVLNVCESYVLLPLVTMYVPLALPWQTKKKSVIQYYLQLKSVDVSAVIL